MVISANVTKCERKWRVKIYEIFIGVFAWGVGADKPFLAVWLAFDAMDGAHDPCYAQSDSRIFAHKTVSLEMDYLLAFVVFLSQLMCSATQRCMRQITLSAKNVYLFETIKFSVMHGWFRLPCA
ncbi:MULTISPECIES: hypothetical protein [unclassified Pseudomonas]|uniref:hypothetical protein n=1 Tax=unclassified Pseudomonas TaxID=196821 RepID=UPI0012FE0999|nr:MULTISPECIES: hypothetical protein [unclassified Pseudomonas]MCU1737318.1 hypothetical protein [Pseudomonas sp. 20S_6.2_Bac1]